MGGADPVKTAIQACERELSNVWNPPWVREKPLQRPLDEGSSFEIQFCTVERNSAGKNQLRMPHRNPNSCETQRRSGSGVDVLDRAFAILQAFRREDQPLTLAELSVRTGLYKSTLLRLTASLSHHRMLFRLEDGRYQLGSASLSLSTVYQANLNLGDLLLSPMRKLNEELGETVSFHIREGDHRICLYRINSRHAVRAEVRQGDMQPLDRGAGGRVLLAFSGEPGLVYAKVRQTFCYISCGERDPETSGISAPVFGVEQELVGALGIVGPVSRLGRAQLAKLRGRLLNVAASMTDSLGGDAGPLYEASRT
jgi:DNA-binding IclR family transcriptional regulator